jgi:hypothetical protein
MSSMKYIKPYQIFESGSVPALTKEQIRWLDKCSASKWSAGKWRLNTSTGLVDVDRDFNCSKQGLTDLKGVKFGVVGGAFRCKNNQLTSLVGAPQTVGGGFDCQDNQLTSLVGAPQAVGGRFDCHDNQLTTLEGAPQTVGGHFDCSENQLTSLVGAPQTVGAAFSCKNNQLTSLVGAPQTVKGSFNCNDNQLTTLEGSPQTIKRDFNCYNNQLTTLEGAPQTIKGIFRPGNKPASESTLKAIFALMKKGESYQEALKQYWPEMEEEDRVLMHKQIPNLSPEDARKYKALATYANIKNYL